MKRVNAFVCRLSAEVSSLWWTTEEASRSCGTLGFRRSRHRSTRYEMKIQKTNAANTVTGQLVSCTRPPPAIIPASIPGKSTQSANSPSFSLLVSLAATEESQ